LGANLIRQARRTRVARGFSLTIGAVRTPTRVSHEAAALIEKVGIDIVRKTIRQHTFDSLSGMSSRMLGPPPSYMRISCRLMMARSGGCWSPGSSPGMIAREARVVWVILVAPVTAPQFHGHICDRSG